MTLTPEQEKDWRAQLEQAGVSNMREEFNQGRIQSAYHNLTSRWLAEKEREENSRKDASIVEQIELMRRASAAAERQAMAAERANTRATIALKIAIVSAIITIIGILVTHWDVHK
jgi:hypothetical protein